MKKIMVLTLAIFMVLSLCEILPVSAAETVKWDFNNGAGSWYQGNGATPKLSFDTSTSGILAVNISATDANMTSAVNFPSTYNKIKIRMKNATSSTNIEVFFGTSLAPGFLAARSKVFNGIGANMTEYTDVILDMSSLSTWVGTIVNLRIDIANAASSGTVYIDSIEIIKDSKVAWDFTSGSEGWNPTNKVTFDSPVTDVLGINISGNDAYIMNSTTDIDSRYNKIKIRLKNETSATLFQVYFLTNVVTTLGPTVKKDFATEANMTEYKDFIFDMSSVANWANFIRALRFDIADTATSGKVYIDSVQLLFDTTALSTKIAEAQGLTQSDYVSGWDTLQSAVVAGQALVGKSTTTATTADNAVAAIDNALSNLIHSASLAPINNDYVNVFSEGFGTALDATQIAANWATPFSTDASKAYMFAGDSVAKVSWNGSGVAGNGAILATAKSYQNYKLETNVKVVTTGISSTLALRNAAASLGDLRSGDTTIRPGSEGIMLVLSGTSIAADEFAIVFKNGTATKAEYIIKYPYGVLPTQDTAITIYDLDDTVYISVGGVPVARIELTGLVDHTYSSGSVYTSKNVLVGTPFSGMIIKRSGMIAYSTRGTNAVFAVNDINISQLLEATQTVANTSFDKSEWGTGNSAGNKAKVGFIAGAGYTVNLSVKVDKSLGRSTLELKNEAGTVVDSKKIDCFFVTATWVSVKMTVPSKGEYTLEITADGSNYSEIADIQFKEGLGASTAGNGIEFDGVVINEGGIS